MTYRHPRDEAPPPPILTSAARVPQAGATVPVVVLERMEEAYLAFDAAWRMTYLNAAAERLLGRPRDELLGQVIWESFPAAVGSAFQQQYDHARASGEMVSFVAYSPPKDRWFSVRAYPGAQDDDALAVYLQDVTDAHREEERHRWQAALLDQAHDAMFVWELGGPITYWNAGAALQYGYSSAEAVGRTTYELLRTEVLDGLDEPFTSFAAFEAALARAGEWQGTLRHTTRDGRHLTVSGRMQLVRTPDGRHVVLESARDITERKRTEQRTREALEALLAMAQALVERPAAETEALDVPAAAHQTTRSVAHHLAELVCDVLGCQRVGLIAVDQETRRQRALAVVGLTPEQEPRWWAEQEELPPYGEGADPDLLARFEAGEAIVLDMTAPPLDQLPNPYDITTSLAVPMRLGRTVVGILSLDHGGAHHTYTRDELALAEAVGQLAALVIERERLLEERAAAEARALAQREATRRMDDFLSIVSHELKTPVTTLSTYLQLLARHLPRMRAAAEAADEHAPLAQEIEFGGPVRAAQPARDEHSDPAGR